MSTHNICFHGEIKCLYGYQTSLELLDAFIFSKNIAYKKLWELYCCIYPEYWNRHVRTSIVDPDQLRAV